MQELGQLFVDLGADGARAILALVAGYPAGDHIVRIHLMKGHLQLFGNLYIARSSRLQTAEVTLCASTS